MKWVLKLLLILVGCSLIQVSISFICSFFNISSYNSGYVAGLIVATVIYYVIN